VQCRQWTAQLASLDTRQWLRDIPPHTACVACRGRCQVLAH
jgi:hypothetical protein